MPLCTSEVYISLCSNYNENDFFPHSRGFMNRKKTSTDHVVHVILCPIYRTIKTNGKHCMVHYVNQFSCWAIASPTISSCVCWMGVQSHAGVVHTQTKEEEQYRWGTTPKEFWSDSSYVILRKPEAKTHLSIRYSRARWKKTKQVLKKSSQESSSSTCLH